MARRRRSQFATVRRRSRTKAFLRAMRYIHEYEREVILRDCEAMTSGGNMEISANRLRLFAPMRYSRHLQRALARLAREGHLRYGSRVGGNPNYRLPTAEENARREARDAAREAA